MTKSNKPKPMGIQGEKEIKPPRQTAPRCLKCLDDGKDVACVATSTQGRTTYYKCPMCEWTTKKVKSGPRLEDAPPGKCPYCKDQTCVPDRRKSTAFTLALSCPVEGCPYTEFRSRQDMRQRIAEHDDGEGLSVR